MDITGFDMAVIGLVLISAIISFARGFVSELLTVAAFIAAALAALWGAPPLWEAAEGMIQPAWVAKAVIVFGVFMVVYIGVTMVTGSVTNMLHRNDQVGFFDRFLGLAFGVGRGVLVAALLLLIYNMAIPQDKHPGWLTEARTYPLVNKTASAIQAAAPQSARIAARTLPPVD